MDSDIGGSFIPKPIIVTGFYAENVFGWIKIGKGCRALSTHIDPVVVKSFQHISILVFITGSEIDANIIDRKKIMVGIEVDLFCCSDIAFQNTIRAVWLDRLVVYF